MSRHGNDVELVCQHSSLCYSPWHILTVAGRKWIVKSVFSEHHYEILFSDFTNVWSECLDGCDIKQRSKEVNPSLEIDVSKLLVHIHHCIMECNCDSSYDILLSPDLQLTLNITSKLSGLPLRWKFHAVPVSLDMIRHHLTEPLMAMVSELNHQKNELITVLKNKDREIADLKAQGVSVSRKKLETVAFDETLFSQTSLQSQNFHRCIQDAASSTFSSSGQLLYSEIMKVCQFCSAQKSSQHSDEDTNTDSCSHNDPSTAPSSDISSQTTKSPHKPNSDLAKEIETQRRLALEKRLAEQEKKDSVKKKKKLKF